MTEKRRVECCGNPLKPKYGLTPISCHAVLERSACAPFIKERRMECVNATTLRRKSGTQVSLLYLEEKTLGWLLRKSFALAYSWEEAEGSLRLGTSMPSAVARAIW
jgi:hypothetical protein